MKKIVLIGMLLFLMIEAKSQVINYRWHTYAKMSGGLIDSSGYINGGLSAEYMVFKRFGLNYNLEFQHRTDKYNHVHASVGSLAGPPLIVIGLISGLANSENNSSNSESVFGLGYLGTFIGLLITVLPDGVSYHFPIGYKWDVAPYANVLGFDWIRNREKGYSEFKYSCSFGVRGTYLIKDRMTAIGFIETRKVASTGWGIGAGIGLGYLFKLRENDKQDNPN
ncbi:MAG: hypothetical protein ACKO7P_11505 [Bacteroidota bacterium]